MEKLDQVENSWNSDSKIWMFDSDVAELIKWCNINDVDRKFWNSEMIDLEIRK